MLWYLGFLMARKYLRLLVLLDANGKRVSREQRTKNGFCMLVLLLCMFRRIRSKYPVYYETMVTPFCNNNSNRTVGQLLGLQPLHTT